MGRKLREVTVNFHVSLRNLRVCLLASQRVSRLEESFEHFSHQVAQLAPMQPLLFPVTLPLGIFGINKCWMTSQCNFCQQKQEEHHIIIVNVCVCGW